MIKRIKEWYGMLPEHFYRRLLMLISGGLLIGVGTALVDMAGWGGDPLTAFFQGTVIQTGLRLSTVTLLTNIAMTVLAFILDHNQVGLGTLIQPFLVQIGIEIAVPFVPVFDSHELNFMVCIIGFLIIAYGASQMIIPEIGKDAYDAFLLAVMKHVHMRYTVVRWVSDGLLLLTGVLMGAPLTMAAVVAILGIGRVIEGFTKMWKKIVPWEAQGTDES